MGKIPLLLPLEVQRHPEDHPLASRAARTVLVLASQHSSCLQQQPSGQATQRSSPQMGLSVGGLHLHGYAQERPAAAQPSGIIRCAGGGGCAKGGLAFP